MRRALPLLVLLILVGFAPTASACLICHWHDSFDYGWCDLPPNNSWGYDECTMRTVNGHEICSSGQSMCYYTEVGGGGYGGGGTGGGGDVCYSRFGCPPECFSCGGLY